MLIDIINKQPNKQTGKHRFQKNEFNAELNYIAGGEMKIKRQTHRDEVGRLSINQSKGVYKQKAEQEQNTCTQQQPVYTVFKWHCL